MKKSESEKIAEIEGMLFEVTFMGKKTGFSLEEVICSECLDYQNERPLDCKEVHTCPTCGFQI